MKILFFLAICLIFLTSTVWSETDGDNIKQYKVATIIAYPLDKHMDEKEIRDRMPFVRSIVKNGIFRSWYVNYELNMPVAELEKRIEYIYKEVKKYEPNMVLVYGNIAFEYFLIKKYYIDGKNNSIFYCIPDSFYKDMNTKYDLKNYLNQNLVHGTLVDTNFRTLKNFFKVRNFQYDVIYLIRNNRYQDDMITEDFKQVFLDKNVEIFKADNESTLIQTLKTIQKKPKGVIVSIASFYTNSMGIPLKDEDLANTFSKYNKKHLDISYFRNLSQYNGTGISYVAFSSKDQLLSEKSPCNIIFHSKYHGIKPPNNIGYISSKIIVNSTRLEKTKHLMLLDNLEEIQNVWR